MQHGSPDLEVIPYEYTNTIMEQSNDFASIIDSPPKVCFKVAGRYVELYTIHFWVAYVNGITIKVYQGGVHLPDQV